MLLHLYGAEEAKRPAHFTCQPAWNRVRDLDVFVIGLHCGGVIALMQVVHGRAEADLSMGMNPEVRLLVDAQALAAPFALVR